MCAELWFGIIFLTHGKLIALHTENILRRNLLGMVTRREQKKTHEQQTFAAQMNLRIILHWADPKFARYTHARRVSPHRCAFNLECEAEKNGQIEKHGFLKAFYIRRNNNKLVEKGEKSSQRSEQGMENEKKWRKVKFVLRLVENLYVCIDWICIGCDEKCRFYMQQNKYTHNPNHVGN